VERYYFDTHVLEASHIRRRLVEGLMQCGDTCLPDVRVVKRLRHFLEDDLEAFCGAADRWVLHPGATPRIHDIPRDRDRVVIAIGPEGGWLESEVEGFMEHGFQPVSLLNRILRSDTATLAALALANTVGPYR
jgi:RsmE family RNA methyltransferase